jgi:hypothetical protein
MAAVAMAKTISQVDANFAVFQQLLPELMQTHAGKFALMNDGKIVEFFDSFSDAVRVGNSKFGDANFSVQEVASKDINLGYYSYAVRHAAD